MLRFLKCLIGMGNLSDICWFSANFYDIHDYHKNKGGDGIPTHFYKYNCHSCKKEFRI